MFFFQLFLCFYEFRRDFAGTRASPEGGSVFSLFFWFLPRFCRGRVHRWVFSFCFLFFYFYFVLICHPGDAEVKMRGQVFFPKFSLDGVTADGWQEDEIEEEGE